MESVDFLASCTSIYSIGRARKKLLLSCSNPRPDSCLGKISRRASAWLDESLAWVLTEVALLRMYNMCLQQPAGFRHFTEVCEVASHVSRRFPPIHLKNRRTFTLFTSRVLYCQKHPSFACTWPGCQPHEPGYLSNHK
jgi:hypothetical protein